MEENRLLRTERLFLLNYKKISPNFTLAFFIPFACPLGGQYPTLTPTPIQLHTALYLVFPFDLLYLNVYIKREG